MLDVTEQLYHTAPLENGRVLLSDLVHQELRVEASLVLGKVRADRNDPTITLGFVYRSLLEKLVWTWAYDASASFCESEHDIRLRQEGMFRYMLGRFRDGAHLFKDGVYLGTLSGNDLSISHATPPVV